MFKKDDYIVLLSTCTGHSDQWFGLPINYCYKLSRDSYNDERGFSVYKDNKGHNNGWSCPNYGDCKLELRLSTQEEIEEYNKLGKPYNIITLKKDEDDKGLIIGKIYYTKGYYEYIFIYNGPAKNNERLVNTKGLITIQQKTYKDSTNLCNFEGYNFREATFSERQWLEACIKANKYISKEEALNSNKIENRFIVYLKYYGRSKLGKIDEIIDIDIDEQAGMAKDEGRTTLEKNWVKRFETYNEAKAFSDSLLNKNLKIENMEEELSFLPQKWCIKDNSKIVGDYFNFQSNRECYPLGSGYLYSHNRQEQCILNKGDLSASFNRSSKDEDYTEITFEQFEKWVLKRDIVSKSLIGRYIKALVDYPNGGHVKAGEIGKFIDENKVDFPSQKGYAIPSKLDPTKYELILEGFNPEGNTNLNNFEVNKWYILTSGKNKVSKCWYIKYKEIRNGIIWSSEFITDNRKLNTSVDCFGKIEDYTLTLLTDLSEIQQYLPKGHIDKLPKKESKKMSKEELLKEAERRYPIGTKYIPVFRVGRDTDTSSGTFIMNDLKTIVDRHNSTSVYCLEKDKWAEIVSKHKYPLGPINVKNYHKYKTESNNIPSEKLIHGCYNPSHTPNAEIVDYCNHFYIVKYINKENNIMQLGFEEDNLEAMINEPKIEYLVREWPSGTLTMGCKNGVNFKSLETYNYEGGVNENSNYGLWKDTYNSKPHLEATKEQINYFLTHGTLTTFINFNNSTKLDDTIKPDDWVIRLRDGDFANHVTKGKAYKVIRIDHNGIIIISDKNRQSAFNTCYFRKALPHEIPDNSIKQSIKQSIEANKNLDSYELGKKVHQEILDVRKDLNKEKIVKENKKFSYIDTIPLTIKKVSKSKSILIINV